MSMREKKMEAKVKVIRKIYSFLKKCEKQKEIVVYGGAGSGKSYTVAQFLIIEKLLSNRNKDFL